MRVISAVLFTALFAVAFVPCCVQTTAPPPQSVQLAPSAQIEAWIVSGVPFEVIVERALAIGKAGDDDMPTRNCGNSGPPQSWELWRGSDGTRIIKWSTVCGTYYQVIMPSGDEHCFGPQGDPNGCPV